MLAALRRMVSAGRRRIHRRLGSGAAALAGYPPSALAASRLEHIDDPSLQQLNQLLPWHCFLVDREGRRFGNVAWEGKRSRPQLLPDPRIELLDRRIGLRGKTVLEVGCFEGIHTAALCALGADVLAMDARVENVVKTLVRCWALKVSAQVEMHDVERQPLATVHAPREICHHAGVLYHLRDPVAHLMDIGRMTTRCLMLDTHVVEADDTDSEYESGGQRWRYRRYQEQGRQDPFSGMYDHAKWLSEETIIAVLRLGGFTDIEVNERRAERNGPRLLMLATKAPGTAQSNTGQRA